MLKFVSLVPKKVREDYYVIDKIKYIDTDTLSILTKDIENKDYSFVSYADTYGDLDKYNLVGKEIFMPKSGAELVDGCAILSVPIDGFGVFTRYNKRISISSTGSGVTSIEHTLDLNGQCGIRITGMYIPQICNVIIELLVTSQEIHYTNHIYLNHNLVPLSIKSSGNVQSVKGYDIKLWNRCKYDFSPKFLNICSQGNIGFCGYLIENTLQIVHKFTALDYVPTPSIKFMILCKNAFYSVNTLVIPETIDYLLYEQIHAPEKTDIKNLYICKDKPYTEDFLLNILSSFIDTKYIALLGLDSDKLRDMLLEYINVEFI